MGDPKIGYRQLFPKLEVINPITKGFANCMISITNENLTGNF